MTYFRMQCAAVGCAALLVIFAGPRDVAAGDPECPSMHHISAAGSETATNGGGGKIATRDGKTHVVWQDSTAPAEPKGRGAPVSDGYLNRIRTLDHATGEWTKPITLNRGVDNHARPNIVMDPAGYLHAIISGHNSPVTYMRSKRPNDASAWTEPVDIDAGTYPIPIAGPDGTLYLVMRSAKRWNGVNFYVKPPDGEWQKRAHLVHRDPEMPGYAAFHAGLALDARGTLHAVIDFYESGDIYEKRGLHQAITYMRSADGGRTWATADGTPIDLPARPKRMDVIAQDRAKARHEDMPPPLLVSAGSMVLDDQQRPHVLYIDHRMGPGQITHATSSEAGEWSRTPIDAINHVFPEHRPTSMRGSFTRRADGTMYALLELVPHGEGWMNGVPIRAMRRMELDKRLAWLVSRDGGETWDATKALDGGDFNQPNVERPVGGNQPPADTAPPFIYFTGERRYPEEGEVIHNDVYLVMPEMDVESAPVSDAASEPATTPTPYASREAWSAAVPEQYRDHPAFAWPEPDPALPNVLLIGDSISIGYTLDVRRRLQGIANLFRIPDNARSTRQTLGQIETFLGEMRWDVIHFNWGIHDVTLMNDVGETDPAGSPQVPAEQYRDNLERLVRRLKATRAELIWASTTPVASDVTLRDDARIEQYNAIAAELMDRHFVTVNDLRGLVRRADESWWTDGVHFTEAGSSALGRAVAGVILNRLGLRDIQPLLNSEPKRRASPGDESEHFTWTLPLDNPASGRAVRASVAPAADNGPAWTIRTEPDELHLDPGASGELTIHAEADPIRPRYPLPEVVLSIEPDSADRAAERTHATRKRLNVSGAQRPLSIARADRPPQLDGELSDPIWPDAPTVPLFGRMDMQRRITPPTAAWLTYDDDHLYVAYRCDEPEMAAIQHAVTERDGPVYDDDSVELLVSPDATGEPFYHLIVNPNGAVYDARNKDRRVDLDGLRIATGHEAAGWTVEIAVSWTTLGVSKPPDALRMLLARNRQAGGTPTVFQFPISPAGNRMPEQFGIVRLK